MSDVILYAALKENQRLNSELLTLKTGGAAGGGDAGGTTSPDILYSCTGCWNGSATIPEANRGVYNRYEIVGHTNYWQYYCSQATFGFAGACSGSCQDNFAQYCCAHCTCGWMGDFKCFNSSNSYECSGAVAWPFGCSSGCDTACTSEGFNFHASLSAENSCCGSAKGFHYCFASSHNGNSNWCCIGVRNSGRGYSCCGGHPACLRGICFSTPSGSNPFAQQTSVTIIGYGKITP